MDIFIYTILAVAILSLLIGRSMTEHTNILIDKLDGVLKELQEIKTRLAFAKKRELEANKTLKKIIKRV